MTTGRRICVEAVKAKMQEVEKWPDFPLFSVRTAAIALGIGRNELLALADICGVYVFRPTGKAFSLSRDFCRWLNEADKPLWWRNDSEISKRLPRDNKGLWVYFAQVAIPDGPIKIGISKNPERRISILQESMPYDLVCLGVIGGNFKLEKRLHMALQGDRLRCEWFRPSADLLVFIGKYAKPLTSIAGPGKHLQKHVG